ncbi:formate--tetrahydrofolate ligase [Salinisphaera sp. P385]|uniref:Formate--tetrahydrofolate ligase n=1 Tax=Spectribacter acetivorans TaxID=3075603 RepID=A0ABU3B763_9GAMM|nr:formate--tetrahydrofolate ligase [Salinisphaera sp. P385]MDT0618289.1 formate--tetrahydrofolate ligase [Salinisphaera sp. P385]
MTKRNDEKLTKPPNGDAAIARAATLKPIREIGERLGVPWEAMAPYGHTKAKIDLDYIASLADRPDGKLILVTGLTPTPPGEGKTTTTVGLTDALSAAGENVAACLREPSLGPCFGMKGGAAGGGHAQVVPMDDLNLHFTGDMHAIGMAHNLLAAMIDNHINWRNELNLDPRRVSWRRVMDMNERALRDIVIGLGTGNGMPREDGFDITVASEIMAILCLATDMADLQARLARIVVAETRDRQPVTAADLEADGAMAVLLKDAIRPNLVQTLENTPVFVHGGPFANIAHGCNSVIATRAALKLADYVVTEAGFGADLGAEKFFDIKCRMSGLKPAAAVIVATARALKVHGGNAVQHLEEEDVEAVRKGCDNLRRHIRNIRSYGVPAIVAINRFPSDTDAELDAIAEEMRTEGVETSLCTHFADGGAGAADLARTVTEVAARDEADFKPIYPDDMELLDKIRTVAQKIYGAADVDAGHAIRARLKNLEKAGYGHFPVCIAKTQYSFTTDPNLRGAPSGHTIPVREVRLSAGAGFIVVICGEIMTMPGLPRRPAAADIRMHADGHIEGLF